MRLIVLLIASGYLFVACNNAATHSASADSTKTIAAYKPGFGEFMSGIQVHHAKLWFAGINQNWPLADFEINEIKESIDNLKLYQQARVETKYLGMIDGPLDSVAHSINNKDEAGFRKNFLFLTNTCNNCHHEVNFEFNKVKIPDTPPFSNQDFSPAKQ
ncbi:MAG: hypothetical protein EKK37_03280 [Sphingobacteriales bacterium]|nr:MAG: hypothetical protein EKK37_03280 [Sphingobacteriales bacterium]